MSKKVAKISRREALVGAGAVALFATLPNVSRAAAQPSFVANFSDPVDAIRAHVKLVGSLDTDTVISFYRLNVYADLHDGNYVPMFTLNNLLVDKWQAKSDNTYQMLKYEAGYFSAMDDYEPIADFEHLLTKKTTKVHNFRLGPVPRTYQPERFSVMAFHPDPLPLEIIADRVFLATQSIEAHPGFIDPKKTRYTNSFMTYSATLADMQNATLPSAPVHAQLQNKTEWLPWMNMEGHPGATIVRGFGGKVASFDALPPDVLRHFEDQVPQILDTENWQQFVSERTEFTD